MDFYPLFIVTKIYTFWQLILVIKANKVRQNVSTFLSDFLIPNLLY